MSIKRALRGNQRKSLSPQETRLPKKQCPKPCLTSNNTITLKCTFRTSARSDTIVFTQKQLPFLKCVSGYFRTMYAAQNSCNLTVL